jgi:hypothetical protein
MLILSGIHFRCSTKNRVLTGDAPAFVKLEGPLYAGGPVRRIELAIPAGF